MLGLGPPHLQPETGFPAVSTGCTCTGPVSGLGVPPPHASAIFPKEFLTLGPGLSRPSLLPGTEEAPTSLPGAWTWTGLHLGCSLFQYLIVKNDSTQFRPDLRKIKRKRKKVKELDSEEKETSSPHRSCVFWKLFPCRCPFVSCLRLGFSQMLAL